jgi:hypothetical protein
VVEFPGEPGPVVAKRVNLRSERLLAARRLASAFGRRVKRIEGLRQAPTRSLDRIGLVHAAIPTTRSM